MKSEMTIPRKTKEVKSFCLCNAYGLKLEKEYNTRTSVPHPNSFEWVKIYADLTGIETVRTTG